MNINEKMVNTFKAFGDETRLKIINLLSNDSLSVNTIAQETNMNQSAISHQLHILKMNGIVKSERRGKEIFYSLDDEHVKVIIKTMYEHISHNNHD